MKTKKPPREFPKSLYNQSSFVVPLLMVFSSCTTLFLLFSNHEWVRPSFLISEKQNFSPNQIEALPQGLLVTGITPEKAKHRHLMWLHRRFDKQKGAGLDVLGAQAPFAELFPNYPDKMRKDQSLWWEYFRRPFDSDVWLPSFAQTEFQVHTPWLGCPSIFERYGGDTLVLGDSETFVSLIPKVLAEKLPGSNKVLFCTRNAMTIPSMISTTKYLRSLVNGRPFKQIIFGFDERWAEKEGLEDTGQDHDFASFVFSRKWFLDLLTWKGSNLFSPVTWDDVEPLHFGKAAETEAPKSETEAGPGLQAQELQPFAFSVRKSDVPFLSSIAKGSQSYYRKSVGTLGGDCQHLQRLKDSFNELVDSSLLISDKVYIFRPPVTEIEEARAAPCLGKFINDLLLLRASARVKVNLASRRDYHLNWQSFAKASDDPNLYWVDLNHVNYEGALRVTDSIGDWIAKDGTRQ